MFYHHVLAWKACYTYFSAVLFKPTSRTSSWFPLVLLQAKVVGKRQCYIYLTFVAFPLVLLQAKVVGARFLNHDTARLSDPQIYAPLWWENQHGNFCQNDSPQTQSQYGINAGQRENQGFSDSGRCVCEVFLNTKNHLPATLNIINND